jgi:hypothetical protein
MAGNPFHPARRLRFVEGKSVPVDEDVLGKLRAALREPISYYDARPIVGEILP